MLLSGATPLCNVYDVLVGERCRSIVQISEEWSNGAFVIKPGDEDVHTANERRLKVSDVKRTQ